MRKPPRQGEAVKPVMTVLGERDAADLGVVLPHEHVLFDMFTVDGHADHRLKDVDRQIVEVKRAQGVGVGTIVDVTVRNMGRDPEGLARISLACDIGIVMGTGWYRHRWYEDIVTRLTVPECAALLVDEIRHGVGDTGIRPGIIGEVGTEHDWITPLEERGFRAAARAHHETGLTITTHAYGSPIGLTQLDLLVDEESVPPGRVIVGHCDTHPEKSYIEAILARGAWVQLDTIRVVSEWEFRRRAEIIEHVVENGHAHQLLLSQDICATSLLATAGGAGYTCLLADFLPYLEESTRLSTEEIRRLVTNNPQRALVDEPEPW